MPVSGADRFNIGSDVMTMRRIGVMLELTASELAAKIMQATRVREERDETLRAHAAEVRATFDE